MLEMNTLYPACAPNRNHHFILSQPPLGMFGTVFTYCDGCGLTPKQLLDIRRVWNKEGLDKQ